MTRPIFLATAVAAALTLLAASTAGAQTYLSTPVDGMLNQAIGNMNALGSEMQGYEAQITQGAMNDPQIQMAYQNYIAQGGYPQDFQTWAFNYRATNGYDPNAVRQTYQQQFANTGAEQNAYNGYLQAQRNSAAALGGMQNGFADNMNQAGMNLQGQATYADPNGGQVPLSYMPNAQPTYNPQNGLTYVPNGNGSYTVYDQAGNSQQMYPGQ